MAGITLGEGIMVAHGDFEFGNHDDESVTTGRKSLRSRLEGESSCSLKVESRVQPFVGHFSVRLRAGDKGSEYLARNVLCNKLFDANELEKKRIARDLHDGVGQILTNINLRIGKSVAMVRGLKDPRLRDEAEVFLESIPTLVSEAIEEVREICMSIRPSELDDLGVLKAISGQCRRFSESIPGIRIDTDFSLQEGEIPEDLKTPIYRITQEALNNAIKHSSARKIFVRLVIEDGVLSLSIEDDGAGFDPTEKLTKQALPCKTGIGLTSMKERSKALGGDFDIVSCQGCGTAVRVSWPLGA